jgi:hypothetical protein
MRKNAWILLFITLFLLTPISIVCGKLGSSCTTVIDEQGNVTRIVMVKPIAVLILELAIPDLDLNISYKTYPKVEKVTLKTANVGLSESISGNYFINNCMSGEQGVLNTNFTILGWHGLDYVPNDTRTLGTIGRWTVVDNILKLSGTSISDGDLALINSTKLNDGKFIYDFGLKSGCGVVVGSDIETIKKYQNDKFNNNDK